MFAMLKERQWYKEGHPVLKIFLAHHWDASTLPARMVFALLDLACGLRSRVLAGTFEALYI